MRFCFRKNPVTPPGRCNFLYQLTSSPRKGLFDKLFGHNYGPHPYLSKKVVRKKLRFHYSLFCRRCGFMDSEISLGIEVRDCWTEKTKDELLRVLKNTNLKFSSKFLCIVCPDDISDLSFYAMREIERSGDIKNLSVIRVGDFSKYLTKVIELLFSKE